jgi:hypothetical protein
MSRKYNSIANEFAATLRTIKTDFPNAEQPMLAAWRVINTWMEVERKSNSRFDSDRFAHYINERL